MADTYSGRLVTDGYGNLLADEGDRAGEPVAHDPESGNFIFLKKGEPSHNERHHKQFAHVTGTTDDDSGTPDSPTEGNAHHWGVQEDDPHYDASEPNKIRLRMLPDAHSAKATGHTEAWR